MYHIMMVLQVDISLFFNSESIEDMNFLPTQTKLWKVHGSLGWHIEEETKKNNSFKQ